MLHPNKKLERPTIELLDGIWDCEIIKAPKVDTSFNSQNEVTLKYNPPKYTKKITVPYSPETERSGVKHTLLQMRSFGIEGHTYIKRAIKKPLSTLLLLIGELYYL